MKITKAGIMTEKNEITGSFSGNTGAILTSMTSEEPTTQAKLCIKVGQKPYIQNLMLNVGLSDSLLIAQLSQPSLVFSPEPFRGIDREYSALFLFQNQFFEVLTPFLVSTTVEEAVLQIKKLVYSEDSKLRRLREEVEAIELVVTKKVHKRTPIADAVKLLVWTRDEGKCVRCGSTEKLHFDHIIPVSKGGSASEANIQILCEKCNLQKSDKITF